jgi:plastocyanin
VEPSRTDRHRIRAAASAVIACCALVLACGCGSSAGSRSTASTATTATKTRSSLKANKTPKYASPPASAAVQSGIVQIVYRNIAIAPDTLRVKAGSTVRWTNDDAVEHNVTSDGGPARFASGNFGEARTFEVTLAKAGVIHYLCTIHPTTMNGTIEVVR